MKGGAIQLENREFIKIESILDKFAGFRNSNNKWTYNISQRITNNKWTSNVNPMFNKTRSKKSHFFLKTPVTFENDYGSLIRRYLKNRPMAWIDDILENIDFKRIEDRIWAKLSEKIMPSNNIKRVTLLKPCYKSNITGINDYIVYDQSTKEIKVKGIALDNKALIIDNPLTNIYNFLRKNVKLNASIPMNDTQVSGYQDIDQFMYKANKLIFKLLCEFKGNKNVEIVGNLKLYHDVEKQLLFIVRNGEDIAMFHLKKEGEIYSFHPHNLINFLPKEEDEKLFKSLFKDITEELNKLNFGHTFDNKPDGFWHIHVTKINNEENVALLTCHAAYEIVTRPPYPNIDYKYNNGNRKRISQDKIEKNSNFKKIHNSYLLLNLDSNTHYHYTINEFSDIFNKFNSGASLTESMNGEPVFDINHIEGRGVIIVGAGGLCAKMCNNNDLNPKPVDPTPVDPNAEWQCAACTTFNPPSATVCSVCETPRVGTGGSRKKHRKTRKLRRYQK